MARVLLVTPSNAIQTERQNWSSPHLGIWRLGGWLERCGHQVDVWDTILDAKAPGGDYDWVGMSLTHDTLPDDFALLRSLKRQNPEAEFVVGGPEASTNFQQILQKLSFLNYVVIGEGEGPMQSLLELGPEYRGLNRGGITRLHHKVDLERFTSYNYYMPFEKMRHREHWAITKKLRPSAAPEEVQCVRLNTSTYCDKGCRFCSITPIHRMAAGEKCEPITMTGACTKVMVSKLHSVLPEAKTVYMNDDDFCLSREKVETFFDDPIPKIYHIQARVDTLDKALLKHMAKGGCRRISFGVEAVVGHVLKDLGKGTNPEQTDEVISWCLKEDVEPIILLLLFTPTLSMEDLAYTWRKLKFWEHNGICLSIMSYIRAYHGSWYLESGMHDISWKKNLGLKQPHAVLPDDPDVREVFYEFHKRLDAAESKMKDHWKGKMSSVMIQILGELLKEKGVLGKS